MRRSGIRELHQTGHDLVTDESVLPCPRLTERKALVGHVGDAVPDHVAHAAVPAREGPLTGSRTRRAASSSRMAPTTAPDRGGNERRHEEALERSTTSEGIGGNRFGDHQQRQADVAKLIERREITRRLAGKASHGRLTGSGVRVAVRDRTPEGVAGIAAADTRQGLPAARRDHRTASRRLSARRRYRPSYLRSSGIAGAVASR